MLALMPKNFGAMTKVLPARFTLIRLLTCVNSHTNLQGSKVVETLGAVNTSVRPIVGMTGQSVRLEMRKLSESLFAYLAFIQTFSRMN